MIQLSFQKLKIVFNALESFKLPPFWGGIIRSVFGLALKKTGCHFGKEISNRGCAGCEFSQDCIYVYFIESPLTEEMVKAIPPVMRPESPNFKWPEKWPHPFFFYSPMWNYESTHYSVQKNEKIDLELTLIGRAQTYILEIRNALEIMGKDGLGPDRGKLELIKIASLSPWSDNEKKVLYDKNKHIDENSISHNEEFCKIPSIPDPVPEYVTLHFLTPLQDVYPYMDLMAKKIIGRARMLFYYHQGVVLDFDENAVYKCARRMKIIKQRLQMVNFKHRSSRQKKDIYLKGRIGSVKYNGRELNQALWNILFLGQVVGAGKKITYGLGKYVLKTSRRPVRKKSAFFPRLDLFDRIVSLENVEQAWHEIKNRTGRKKSEINEDKKFVENIDNELPALASELSGGRYVPRPYILYDMNKKDGTSRPIGRALIRDKVAQQAWRRVVEVFWDSMFYDFSYAYRPKKGTKKAIDRVKHEIQQSGPWAVSADINNFFENINHQKLVNAMKNNGLDDKSTALATLWIRMGGIKHNRYWKDHEQGVPQGAVLSPLLSNLYLHQFDEHMDNEKKAVVRYADDFILFGKTYSDVKASLFEAENYLKKELGLRLNPVKEVKNCRSKGVDFLGVYISMGLVSLSRKKQQEKSQWLNQLFSTKIKMNTAERLERLKEKLEGWQRYYFRVISENARESFCAEIIAVMEKYLADLGKKKKESNKIRKTIFEMMPPGLNLKAGISSRSRKINVTGDNHAGISRQLEAVDKRVKKTRRKVKKDLALDGEIIIDRPGIFLGKKRNFIVVKQDGKVVFQKTLSKARHILVLCNGVSFSSNLVRVCSHKKIPIDLTDGLGNHLVRIGPPVPFTAINGLAQLEAMTNEKGAQLAASIVSGKIQNQISLLRYFFKYKKNRDKVAKHNGLNEIDSMKKNLKKIETLELKSIDDTGETLNIIEAQAAKSYWKIIRILVKDNIEGFEKRVKPDANDIFNMLLNYGYGILYTRILNGITLARLNPSLSYLHKPTGTKPTLVYDLIEEFRAPVVDRTIISLVNKKRKLISDNGRLAPLTRQIVVGAVMQRLHTPVDFRGQELGLEGIIVRQAREVGKFLRGEIDKYRVFTARW